jgi:fatty acid desaturase
VAGAVYFLLVPALGFRLEVTVIPMLLTLPVVFGFRALSDHYGLPPLRREAVAGNPPTQTELDIWHQANAPVQHEVTGWVVLTHPFLEWLWSSVNYHEVHHKFPYLSHRHLKAAFDATRGQYPYAVVSGYARSLWLQRKRNYYAAQMPVTGKDGMAV